MESTFWWLFFGAMALAGLVILMILIYVGRYKRVPPDEAMLIFTRKLGKGFFLTSKQVGGGQFILPFFQKVEFLPTDVRTVEIKMEDMVCDGAASRLEIDMNMVAQFRVCRDKKGLSNAIQHQFKRSPKEVNEMGMQILEDHARIMALAMQAWEIHHDRDGFGKDVERSARKEMRERGLETRTLVVKEISDREGFMDAMGKIRTEHVLREAGVYAGGYWDVLIAAKNKQIVMGFYQYAKYLQKAGGAEAAVKEFRVVCILDPHNKKYLKDYMKALGEPINPKSTTPEGREEFMKRRESAIDAAWIEHHKGKRLIDQGKYMNAGARFKRAMDLDPFESAHKLKYMVCMKR